MAKYTEALATYLNGYDGDKSDVALALYECEPDESIALSYVQDNRKVFCELDIDDGLFIAIIKLDDDSYIIEIDRTNIPRQLCQCIPVPEYGKVLQYFVKLKATHIDYPCGTKLTFNPLTQNFAIET